MYEFKKVSQVEEDMTVVAYNEAIIAGAGNVCSLEW